MVSGPRTINIHSHHKANELLDVLSCLSPALPPVLLQLHHLRHQRILVSGPLIRYVKDPKAASKGFNGKSSITLILVLKHMVNLHHIFLHGFLVNVENSRSFELDRICLSELALFVVRPNNNESQAVSFNFICCCMGDIKKDPAVLEVSHQPLVQHIGIQADLKDLRLASSGVQTEEQSLVLCVNSPLIFNLILKHREGVCIFNFYCAVLFPVWEKIVSGVLQQVTMRYK